MNVYETHLPVLGQIFLFTPIKTVLELGMGYGSTPFFLEKGVELTSIETDIGWTEPFKQFSNHIIIIDSCLNYLKKTDKFFDLIFVDNNPASERADCVMQAMQHTDIVVAHDTEPEDDWNYGYSRVSLNGGWTQIDIKDLFPWTTIYTKNHEIIMNMRR